MRLSLLILLSLFIVACLSNECIWKGKLTGRYGIADNWSCGKIPGIYDSIVFNKNAIVKMSGPRTVQSITVGPDANVRLKSALYVVQKYVPDTLLPKLFKNDGILQVAGNLEITLEANSDDTIPGSPIFENDGELYVQGSHRIIIQPHYAFVFNFYNLVENQGTMCVDKDLTIKVNSVASFINSKQFNNDGYISAGSLQVYFETKQTTSVDNFVQVNSRNMITKYLNITFNGGGADFIPNEGDFTTNQITQFQSTNEYITCGRTVNQLQMDADLDNRFRHLKLQGVFNSSFRKSSRKAFRFTPSYDQAQPVRKVVKCQTYKCVAPEIRKKRASKASLRSGVEIQKRLVGLVVVS